MRNAPHEASPAFATRVTTWKDSPGSATDAAGSMSSVTRLGAATPPSSTSRSPPATRRLLPSLSSGSVLRSSTHSPTR